MPDGRSTPRQRPGRPVPARTLNRLGESADGSQRLRVGRGLALRWVAGSPVIRLAAALNRVRLAVSGPTGIPAANASTNAPGSGTVTVYKSNDGAPAAAAPATTVTAYNWAPTAVGDGKNLVIVEIDGDWYVLWEAC